jgi:uncharacterized membrane protein YraQ (UPF0718 family)
MVNEIALVLLYGLLGWKVAALYLVTGLSIAMVAGWVIGKLNLEHQIEGWVRDMRSDPDNAPDTKMPFAERITAGLAAVKDIVGKVWPYVVLGIAVGAGIHGYVPEGFMAQIMGKGAWWSGLWRFLSAFHVFHAAGIVPVWRRFGKGAAWATVLAFMMAVIALSLPDMVILRKVLKPPLIAASPGLSAGHPVGVSVQPLV